MVSTHTEAVIPLELAMNIALGASVAFAGRGALGQQSLWRTPALWALVMLEIMVVLPLTIYLGQRYPDWMVMYLVDANDLSVAARSVLLALLPIIAVTSFSWTRRFLIAGRLMPSIGILAGGVMVTGLIGYLGRTALSTVGTTAAYDVEAPSLKRLVDSGLLYLLIGALLGIAVAWAGTLWRVNLVSRVAARNDKAAPLPEKKKAGFGPRTQPLKTAKKKA